MKKFAIYFYAISVLAFLLMPSAMPHFFTVNSTARKEACNVKYFIEDWNKHEASYASLLKV